MENLKDSRSVQVLGAVLVSLLIWRLWRFTISPMLHPDRPKELPYWLPFIGHAFSFFKSFNNAIEVGCKHFYPSRAPFAMTIAGETIYVATAAEDINTVWKNTKNFSMIPITESMYTNGGLKGPSFKTMFQLHPDAAYNKNNKNPLTPNQMIMELHHQQLHTGLGIEDLMKHKIIPGMLRKLDFSEKHGKHSPAILSHSGGAVTVSLLRLCIDLWITEDTEAYFGPKMLEIAPELPMLFMDWELCNWKLVFGLPPALAADMIKTRDAMINAFARYYRLPKDQRPGSNLFISELERMLRELGLDEEEMGILTLMHYWALVGNAYKLGFWLMAHLANNTTLLAEVRTEVLPAVRPDNTVDENFLTHMCPKLEYLGDEILRLTVSAPLGRGIMQDTVVGGKTLKAGRKVTLPISAMHSNVDIWGSDQSDMRPERFAENPKLQKSISYRPWGGGITMCPGRFLARRSVNIFVAVLLSRYEVEAEAGPFPKPDMSRPSPGIASVIPGQDVKLLCTKRRYGRRRDSWSLSPTVRG